MRFDRFERRFESSVSYNPIIRKDTAQLEVSRPTLFSAELLTATSQGRIRSPTGIEPSIIRQCPALDRLLRCVPIQHVQQVNRNWKRCQCFHGRNSDAREQMREFEDEIRVTDYFVDVIRLPEYEWKVWRTSISFHWMPLKISVTPLKCVETLNSMAKVEGSLKAVYNAYG